MIQKEMIDLAKHYKFGKVLVWITILQVLNLLANIIIAFTVASLFNKLLLNQPVHITMGLILGAIGILIGKGFCHYYSTKLTHYTSHELKYKLRKELFQKLLTFTPQQITKLQISKISQLSVEGIENIETYYSRYLPQFFYSLITPFILFSSLLLINWKIASVLLICVFLIPVSIVAAVKIGKRIFQSYWNKYLNVGKRFVEGVQGLHILKMYNSDQAFQTIMNKESEQFRMMTMRVLRMQLQSITIMDFIAYGGTATGVVLSILSFINGHLSFFGFICFALLSIEFFVPLRLLGSYFHVGLNGVSAVQLLSSVLKTEVEVQEGNNEWHVDGDLELRNVSYTYEDDKEALQHINLTFAKGKMTGIVGASGSGKTTLSHLLQRFMEPSHGNICIGSKNMQDLSTEEIHQIIGSVSNAPHLFSGTIFSNLQMANENVTEEQVQNILQFVRLPELCHNITAPVLSEGVNFSSGQRQKLAIARMLLKNPDVMIFDEATANIDQQSEQDIFQMIDELKKQGKTIIVITHRLQNIVNSDEIVMLADGQLIEKGTHTQLLEQQGQYAQLYLEQQSLENIQLEIGA